MSRLPSSSDISELRAAFILMDSDRDGRVAIHEVQSMLERLGISLREDVVHDLMREASHSGSMLLDEAEFCQWVRRVLALRPTSSAATASSSASGDAIGSANPSQDEEIGLDLVAAFRVFDRDKNGFITRDELRLAMELIDESMTEAALNELLQMADVDKDGRINYEEFAKMLM